MKTITFIKQRDSMGCGVACLAMICKYHSLNISIDRLTSICSATVEGVSLNAILSTAKIIGFKPFAAKIKIEDAKSTLRHFFSC